MSAYCNKKHLSKSDMNKELFEVGDKVRILPKEMIDTLGLFNSLEEYYDYYKHNEFREFIISEVNHRRIISFGDIVSYSIGNDAGYIATNNVLYCKCKLCNIICPKRETYLDCND